MVIIKKNVNNETVIKLNYSFCKKLLTGHHTSKTSHLKRDIDGHDKEQGTQLGCPQALIFPSSLLESLGIICLGSIKAKKIVV